MEILTESGGCMLLPEKRIVASLTITVFKSSCRHSAL